jgi:membrane protease YdiL (CAAX protease family)
MSHLTTSIDPAPVIAPEPPSGLEVSLWRAWMALLWVVGYLAVTVALVFGLHAIHLLDLRSVTSQVYALTLLTAALMLALYLHLIRRNQLSWSRLGFRRPGWRLLHLLWQLPVVVIAATGTEGAVLTLTGLRSRPGSSGDTLSNLSSVSTAVVVLALVIAAVLVPLSEECLFRGAFFSGFARRFGAPWGIVLSAVVFAAFHGAPLVLPYVFVLGLGLAWVRWFHGTLWASFLLHAVNNALSVGVFLIVT